MVSERSYVFFLNPIIAKSEIYSEFELNEDCLLYASDGKLISKLKIKKRQIDLSPFEKDIYNVQFHLKTNNKSKTIKIIKK